MVGAVGGAAWSRSVAGAQRLGDSDVAERSRSWGVRMPESKAETGRACPSGWWYGLTAAIAAATVVVTGIVGYGGIVILAGRDGSEPPDAVLTEGPPGDGTQAPGPSVDCTSDDDVESGMCGLDPEELRETNLAYADRMAFTGDLAAATAIADQARTALGPLADVQPPPTPDQVVHALATIDPHVVVSDNAVRAAGAAFAIEVGGGCVFGSVYDGAVDVEIGGYINDGGCLAVYGH
jgi:hypothetical protein